MIKCGICQTLYPYGTLVCLDDGFQFVTSDASKHLLQLIARRAVFAKGINLLIEHVDGLDFQSHHPTIVIQQIRLSGPPIRIGRRDLSANPQIRPEIDFQIFLEGSTERPPISRIHASIEMHEGRVCLRSISPVPTFYRATGTEHAIPLLREREYHVLSHADTIYLGHPKGRHVRMRVLMT